MTICNIVEDSIKVHKWHIFHMIFVNICTVKENIFPFCEMSLSERLFDLYFNHYSWGQYIPQILQRKDLKK